MTRTASIQAAVAAFMLCWSVAPTSAAEQAVTNRAVAKYLTEARKLAASEQWEAALTALNNAEQVPAASPYAEYKISEFRGYVLTQQRKYGDAAAVFEHLASADLATPGDRAGLLKTASQLYMRAKQYPKAAQAAESALATARNDAALLELAGQAKYLEGNFAGAVERIGQLVAATERKGSKPHEAWLQIVLNSYYKLNDHEQIAQTWEALLRHYPKPEYWRNVVELKGAEPHSERVALYYLALTFDLGILDDAADHETLALGAIDLGLAAEAVRVLESGLQKGVLGGGDEARFRRMLAHAQAEAAKSAAALADLAHQARRAGTGQPDTAVGRAYLSQRKYERAIPALRRGIEKGALRNPDQARIDLGIAYLKSGRGEQAREVFASVQADSEWRELAELWSLRANTTTERNETAQR
jgi:hypothetical protein